MSTTLTSPKQALRPRLEDLTHLSHGKRVRLHRLLYEYGPKNGTLVLLPIDQGLEHGPVDFFDNPDALDPEFQFRLALDGGYSGIALHIGLAEKYMGRYAGKVPLVLKINGKTNIPADEAPLSPLTASVEDAVRLGADAIGYTLYVGSPAQTEDIAQFQIVREEAERYGMPTIVWAYPRGSFAKNKGGIDGLYCVEYAARVAQEVGADVVKVNFPKVDEKSLSESPAPYNTLHFTAEEATRRVVRSAGRTLVLFSGGSKVNDQDLMSKVRLAMDAGATGLIFGRNMWQRPYDDAMRVTADIKKVMLDY